MEPLAVDRGLSQRGAGFSGQSLSSSFVCGSDTERPTCGFLQFSDSVSTNQRLVHCQFILVLFREHDDQYDDDCIAGTYAVKVRMTPVPKDIEGCASMLILGDLSNRVVDELATLVDNVYAPLLCKSENHKDLPEIAVQDISRQVHLIRGTLYQVKHTLVYFD